MTSYSYQNWNMLDQDTQAASPGISIPRDHPVNNPDRGVYWSATTSASALATHIQDTLTGEDRLAASTMWNSLKSLYRQGSESPRMVDRAIQTRRQDANEALGSYHGDLDSNQLEQLTSVFDDVVQLQQVAETMGLDPVVASRRMLDRAASKAIGFELNAGSMDPEFRPLIDSEAGRAIEANLDQSVRQLQALVKDMDLDALDNVAVIGRDGSIDEETRDDHQRLNEILRSIPLILNPVGIEREENFSVRMESKEEATAVETIVHWAGKQGKLPDEREVHRAFASWRDNGLAPSPHTREQDPAVGLILGNTSRSVENVGELLASLDKNPALAGMPIYVLTTEGGEELRTTLAASGRPIFDATVDADRDGVKILSEGEKGPSNRIELINLTREEGNDPVARSLAANAIVGRSSTIGYIPGVKMNALEAQAIHIAGTARKLSMGMSTDGKMIHNRDLDKLREEARILDAAADPRRYYTAGQSRPFEGVNAVAFDGARFYDKANQKHAPQRDLLAESYDRIPRHATVLTVDQPKNATYRWMEENVTDRRVLFAEATRNLSFARVATAGLDGEKVVSREAEIEFKIYDRPANKRDYALEGEGSGVRRVCKTPEIDWNDPQVRGAIILVSGNANGRALNSDAQSLKVAQEAVMDRAHSALILNDFGTDFHAAHMIRLAQEMGKKATVIDGAGSEVPLNMARERTMGDAKNFSEGQADLLNDRMRGSNYGLYILPGGAAPQRNSDYSVGDDVGQLALASLPGMNAAKAEHFANFEITLSEMRTDKSEEMRKFLMDNGMPAETRKALYDNTAWLSAMDRAIANDSAARQMGATYRNPRDIEHPIDQATKGDSSIAVYTKGEFDYAKTPVAAFIGNTTPYVEAGIKGSIDPADTVDRESIRRTIQELTKNGYGIGVTLEEGVSRAVLEEVTKIPEAKVVIVAPGNPMAASPELRRLANDLVGENRAGLIMPTHIAPTKGADAKEGEVRRPDNYVENRTGMRDILSQVSKIGIVVAATDRDQSMHIVRQMNELEKPIAAMVPQDVATAGSDIYSGNLKLLRGAGKTFIESISLAQAPSAQGYAELTDNTDGKMVLENGVRRGTAGTFQSARLSRNEMLRSGHQYHPMSWGSAARPLSSAESITRFVDDVEKDKAPILGKYVEPTDRELEKRRLERQTVSQDVADHFSEFSKMHRNAIMQEAGRNFG